ncbi:class I SAM-dependent methyltransferase [Flavobacterium pectinovorum]|uniref:Class I SAM-dependent methyltransferase n=2 Tax=Flavobacterium pectinovorum TaxID=29533 RepID=A0A502EFI2_9FLAO|nr:class I SAM-dependent methyltransferase [Flavobacterium pectinovorum]
MWDDRYKDESYAYGKKPNLFFAEQIEKLNPGSILMPADGEGRNGVYAAKLGWQVTSFDLSEEGKSKTLSLANEQNVIVDYFVGDFEHLQFENSTYDAIGLIYAHFPADKKSMFHRKLNNYLKPGGIVIFEAFGKKHLAYNSQNPKVGGPTASDMLFSMSEVIADFNNYDIMLLEEQEVSLDEGIYHIGKGSVIRFVGRKRS